MDRGGYKNTGTKTKLMHKYGYRIFGRYMQSALGCMDAILITPLSVSVSLHQLRLPRLATLKLVAAAAAADVY